MCQRFHYCHADEGRELGIGDIDLISMCLEIASNQCITLSDVSLDIFEPPNTWDLFRKDAMKPGTRMLDELDKFMKSRGDCQRRSLPPPEANVAIHLYLLSDLSRHVNGQIIGLRPNGALYIGSHPAILDPTAKAPGGVWTAKTIADAINNGLVASLQPLGLTRLRQPDVAG